MDTSEAFSFTAVLFEVPKTNNRPLAGLINNSRSINLPGYDGFHFFCCSALHAKYVNPLKFYGVHLYLDLSARF